MYKLLSIRHKPVPATQNVTVDQIRATPEVPAHARSKAVPAHFDTVLVQTEEVNKHTRGTYLEGNTVFLGVLLNKADNSFKLGLRVAQLRVIFTMPDHLHTQNIPKCLAYIEWFTPFCAPIPIPAFILSLIHIKIGCRLLLSSLSRLNYIKLHLIPKFGTNFYPARWDSTEILEECTSFLIKKYISITTFYKYNEHLFL